MNASAEETPSSSAGICGTEHYYQHDPDDEMDNSEKLLLVDCASGSNSGGGGGGGVGGVGENKLRQRKGKIINCAKETFDNGIFCCFITCIYS